MRLESLPWRQAGRTGLPLSGYVAGDRAVGPVQVRKQDRAIGLVRAATSGDPLGGGHLRALDGLRGVALLIVFVHHLNYAYPVNRMLPPGAVRDALQFAIFNGWFGVDLFFVLSGFLITTILLKSRDAVNYYRVFYMRRLLRIAPLYYAVLLFAFGATRPWPMQANHVGFALEIWWWASASNLITAVTPYTLSMLSIFWSLAVEEQFYLVWPAVVRRLSRRWLLLAALGAVAAEVVVRVLPPMLRVTDRFPQMIYRLTPLHCDGLLLGAALAIVMVEGRLGRGALPYLRIAAVGLGGAAGAMLWAGYRFYTTPVIALAVAATVAVLVLQNGRGAMSRVLSFGPLRLAGRYSYCMYATQILLIEIVKAHLSNHVHLRPGPTLFIVSYGVPIAFSFGLAAVSWRFFEAPLNGLKRYFPYRFWPAEGVDAYAGALEREGSTTIAA